MLVAALGVCAWCLVAFVPETSWTRISTISAQVDSGDLNQRTAIWAAGLRAFAAHPVLGVGEGAYLQISDRQLGEGFVAHNTFVSVLVELGIVGFLLFAAILQKPPEGDDSRNGRYRSKHQWSYATMAQRDLIQAGIPADQVLVAIPREELAHRTFETAVAVNRPWPPVPSPPRRSPSSPSGHTPGAAGYFSSRSCAPRKLANIAPGGPPASRGSAGGNRAIALKTS